MGETWENWGAREQRAKGRLWGGETKLRVAQNLRGSTIRAVRRAARDLASAATWSARNNRRASIPQSMNTSGPVLHLLMRQQLTGPG